MKEIKETKIFDRNKNPELFDNLIKHAIAPRPICFASTINSKGEVNLSPFSYFNFVSHNPPICIFSPLTRMRDGKDKHTLENIKEVSGVVINIVNYDMVQQQSLASTEYEKGINEFHKAGFTELASLTVKPPRVAESPVQLECKVVDIIKLSESGGAGNLVVAEIKLMHFQSNLLDEKNHVKQADLDLVARLGGNWYCRITKDNLFEVPKPLRKLGIGVDQLPDSIKNSKILTGNHLGLLANIEALPTSDYNLIPHADIQKWKNLCLENPDKGIQELHKYVANLLDVDQIDLAWQYLLLQF